MMTRITLFKSTALAGALVLAGCAGPSTGINSLNPQEARLTKKLNTEIKTDVGGEVHFAFNKATLTLTAQRRLDRMAGFMIENPQVKFNVIGYADAVGSREYNLALGQRRANAAAAYLIRRGVSFTQLQTTVSLGEEELAVATAGREMLNRRVVIEVIDYLDEPVFYAASDDRYYPVRPQTAVNAPETVCGGGGLVDLCASASLLNVMDLETSAQVSRDLQIELGLLGDVDLEDPDGTLDAELTSTVDGVADATVEVTGDLVDTIEDTVDGLLGG